MFKKMLVAFGSLEIGQQVFDEALSLAKANDACLMLLYVLSLENESYPDIYSFPVPLFLDAETFGRYQNQLDSLKKQCLEFLQTRTNEATAIGVKTELTLGYGSPDRVICSLARTWNADLIVVGRRGLSGVSELFMGSVSNYVLHHAPCSVLVVQQASVSPESQVNQLDLVSARKAHRDNMQTSLEDRLEVARAKGDKNLIRQLEVEQNQSLCVKD